MLRTLRRVFVPGLETESEGSVTVYLALLAPPLRVDELANPMAHL